MVNPKNKTKNVNIGAIAIIVAIIGVAAALIIATICGSQLPSVSIDYAGSKQSAKITINGKTEDITDQIETVEAVDVENKEQVNTKEEEKEEETGGQGAYFGIDATSPATVKDTTLGRCINIDGAYGAQCWDLVSAVSTEQTGRRLSTCGTGAASGMMNCIDKNAGSDYDVIWDATQIRPGDILVFRGGQYGHTGIALGYYNNGYVVLLGQNQGGGSCDQGGSSTNMINISTKNFIGAYRWKGWNYLYEVKKTTPAPAVQVVDNSKTTYTYKKGDYFSKVLVRLGYSGGKLWGKNGTVAYYTKQLIQQGVLDARGNVKIGVPFTLTRK